MRAEARETNRGVDVRGTRALLLFGLLTVANGTRLVAERAADLLGLRAFAKLSPEELWKARPYQRVQLDGATLRPKDVLYRRTDTVTQGFYESDPRASLTVTGATELAALVARRRELHGVHVVVDGVALDAQPFLLDRDTREVKGAAFVDRMYAPLAGTGDALFVGGLVGSDRLGSQAALHARTRFEGTLVMLREQDRFDDLYQSLRSAGRKDPYDAKAFVVLDGEAAPGPDSVQRLVPIGPTNNLFAALPDRVDANALAGLTLEGTLAAPIEDPIPRMALRRLVLTVRNQTEQHQPLRVVVLGSVGELRKHPGAPWLVHPGGAFQLLLGLFFTVLGFRWGARDDRSEVEGKLRFDLIVGAVELLVVVVPIAWFLWKRSEGPPPAPPLPLENTSAAAILSASVTPAAASVPAPAPGALEAVITALTAVRKANDAKQLGLATQAASVLCEGSAAGSSPLRATCARTAPLASLETAVALLGKKPTAPERRALCLAADAAGRKLTEAHESDDPTIKDLLVEVGRLCR